jgi:hypothetical protein
MRKVDFILLNYRRMFLQIIVTERSPGRVRSGTKRMGIGYVE